MWPFLALNYLKVSRIIKIKTNKLSKKEKLPYVMTFNDLKGHILYYKKGQNLFLNDARETEVLFCVENE